VAGEIPDVFPCGCCAGPEDDRCCCAAHQDVGARKLRRKCYGHGRKNVTVTGVKPGDVLPYYGHREVLRTEPSSNNATRIYYVDAGKEGRGDAFTNYWNGMTIVVERSN
jgi:hypothetical protein